jgi:thiol-disulfide isomerase/thioredoxin
MHGRATIARQVNSAAPGRGPSPRPARRALLRAAALLLLGTRLGPAAGASEVRVGEFLRDAELDGLNGRSRRLADFRGRPLLINVWASWCGPCLEEMASLERLAWTDGRLPFAMIGVSTDDYRDRALAVLRHTNATITHFIDHDLVLEEMLGARHIPLTVLVDAQGRVRDKIPGAQEWDQPEALQRIARALGGPRPVVDR